MRKLTLAIAAGATAAVLAGPVFGDTVYVYRDGYRYSEPRVVVEPRVISEPSVIYEPAVPYDRYHVSRPYYAYDSYYVFDPALQRYVPRYRYRVVDDSGRSYPVTATEAERLYGYPYGYDGNPGYLVWNGNRIVVAADGGLTRDSNPNDYASGHYNPKH